MDQKRLNALVDSMFQALFVKSNPLPGEQEGEQENGVQRAFSSATIQEILDSIE